MGATVSVELFKPLNGSDVLNLDDARSEIIRLRTTLGSYAKQGGFSDELVLDASDLVQGSNEIEDFNRCLQEIIHIRKCLQLHTQHSKRQLRGRGYERKTIEDIANDQDNDDDNGSDDSDKNL